VTSPYALPPRSVSGPEAGRRVPHAEPPLSAVLLEPLHLCEPRLHREAHRGVVDGLGAQHHRLVGRRGEPVQRSCARLGGVPAPPRLRQEPVAELGLPGSRNLSPATAVHGFPAGAGEPTSLNTPRFSLHGLQPAPRWSVARIAAGDEATCRQVPSPQLTSSGPASAIADTGCDQDPGHARASADTPLPQPRSCCSEARRPCITSRRSTSWCSARRSGWASSSRGKGVPDQVRWPAGTPLGQCRARLRRGVGDMRPPARRPCPRRGPARSPTCGDRSALACEV